MTYKPIPRPTKESVYAHMIRYIKMYWDAGKRPIRSYLLQRVYATRLHRAETEMLEFFESDTFQSNCHHMVVPNTVARFIAPKPGWDALTAEEQSAVTQALINMVNRRGNNAKDPRSRKVPVTPTVRSLVASQKPAKRRAERLFSDPHTRFTMQELADEFKED